MSVEQETQTSLLAAIKTLPLVEVRDVLVAAMAWRDWGSIHEKADDDLAAAVDALTTAWGAR